MSSPDNARLEIPLDALRLIVTKLATPTTGLLQADIWALAGLMGVEISQACPPIILFLFQFIGHIDCNGLLYRCPVQDTPPPDLTTSRLLHFSAATLISMRRKP